MHCTDVPQRSPHISQTINFTTAYLVKGTPALEANFLQVIWTTTHRYLIQHLTHIVSAGTKLTKAGDADVVFPYLLSEVKVNLKNKKKKKPT